MHTYDLLEIPPQLAAPCVSDQPITLRWRDPEQQFMREASFVVSEIITRGSITEVAGKAMVKWAGEKEVVVTLQNGSGKIKVKL